MNDPIEFIRTQTQILPPSIVPEIPIYMATEVTPLWQLTEDRLRKADLPPPFWAFAWPGGQGMSRYILDNPALVKGKRVIDFAAGSGIAAIAAMKAGASEVLAIDIDPLALHAINLNAAHNQVEVKISEGIDIYEPPAKTDLILAGDICYQQSMSTALVRWLHLCHASGIKVLISDPGRAYVPKEGLTKLATYTVPTSRDLEDQDSREVTVWEMESLPILE